jgi:hypothetical protein
MRDTERPAPRWRRTGLTIGLVLLVVAAVPAAAITGPHRVIAGPEDQISPTANGTYLIWTQNSEGSPNRYHAYGRVLGTGGRFRLNADGTRAFAGGIDPGQNRAIYQQIDGSSSDLFWFNLDSRTRQRLPAPVNTAKWEWGPRVSDAFVLFLRQARDETSLWLYDRPAQQARRIRTWNSASFFVATGGVGERYATWTLCGPLNCAAWLHDTTTDVTRRIPTVNDRGQYAPVVDEVGETIYFVRSGHSCGASVGIWGQPVDLSAPAERLVLLPAGIDTDWTMSLQRVGGTLDLWFGRWRCGPAHTDVYELRDIPSIP